MVDGLPFHAMLMDDQAMENAEKNSNLPKKLRHEWLPLPSTFPNAAHDNLSPSSTAASEWKAECPRRLPALDWM